MDFFKVVDFQKAKDIIKSSLSLSNCVQTLNLFDAVGYRAAVDIFSDEELPEYHRSTVDGYAVVASSCYGASDSIPSLVTVVGKVKMGELPDFSIQLGQAAYVPTGGAIPEGANAVVMIEHTELIMDKLAIYKPASVFDNVIKKGDDIHKGERLVAKGQKITPMLIGMLSALGISKIKVIEKLKVAIISTGDEIVEIDKKTAVGQIRDTNTSVIATICSQNNCQVVQTELIKDGFELLDNALLTAVKKADLVFISGGSSIGARDFTEQVLDKEGQILIHGIALKPGKPTIYAKIANKGVFGLPGHPMACLLTLKLLVLDAINELYGDGEAPFVYAKTTVNFPSSPGRLTVQPVSLSFDKEVLAIPLFYKSGMVSILQKANGYALISPIKEGVKKDEIVKIYLLE